MRSIVSGILLNDANFDTEGFRGLKRGVVILWHLRTSGFVKDWI